MHICIKTKGNTFQEKHCFISTQHVLLEICRVIGRGLSIRYSLFIVEVGFLVIMFY